MTPAALRTALATLLSAQLGTYKRPDGGTQAALWIGEPPNDWTVTGVQIRIEPAPEYDNRRVHEGVGIATELAVRVIPHEGSEATAATAVERISQRYETSNPATVPSSERLGIGVQYTLRIRS